ncbi:hypothetical protein BDV93DRAFT_520733 [Ceratobasidium sp. AG-I]|nr:hypothetical protein BDV93DRAFT_520733 [Ceratobasidium sp. AG-I]
MRSDNSGIMSYSAHTNREESNFLHGVPAQRAPAPVVAQQDPRRPLPYYVILFLMASFAFWALRYLFL